MPPSLHQDVDLSPIRIEDLPELILLHQQLQPCEPSLEAMAGTLAETAGDSRHIFLGARCGGRLVGSLLGVVCRMLYGRCRSFMVIEDVVVDAAYRRLGIGRALMVEIERRARLQDCSYLMLLTDRGREGAQTFYRSLGFDGDEQVGFKKKLSERPAP